MLELCRVLGCDRLRVNARETIPVWKVGAGGRDQADVDAEVTCGQGGVGRGAAQALRTLFRPSVLDAIDGDVADRDEFD